MSGKIDRIHLGRLTPPLRDGHIVLAVAIEVGEFLARVADSVLIIVFKRLEAGTVAVLDFHGSVVVAVFRVIDVEPDLLDGVIGAQHEFVGRASDRIAVVLRPEERAFGRASIVVEDLRKGVVERGRGLCVAVQVGPGTDDMETLGETGLHRPWPVRVVRAERGNACVIVVRKKGNGSGVEIRHAKCGEHFLLGGHIGGTARPSRTRAGFVEADFVTHDRARSRFGDVGRSPPIITNLIVAVSQFGNLCRTASDAAGSLRKRSVECVVKESLESPAHRVALCPNRDLGSGFVELLGRCGKASHIDLWIVVDPFGLVAAFRAEGVCRRGIVDQNAAADCFHKCLRAR